MALSVTTQPQSLFSPALIERALDRRDRAATRVVLRVLTPIVQGRVARVLLRWRSAARGRDVRQEVEDLTQAVFEQLLADDGRRLRAWTPERGSPSAFFGLVTERLVANVLNSRRKSPWTEDPSEPEVLETPGPVEIPDAERLTSSRQLLRAVGVRLRVSLNERDQRLFDLMMVQQLEDDDIRAAMDLSRDALYQARRRLKARLKAVAEEITAEEITAEEITAEEITAEEITAEMALDPGQGGQGS